MNTPGAAVVGADETRGCPATVVEARVVGVERTFGATFFVGFFAAEVEVGDASVVDDEGAVPDTVVECDPPPHAEVNAINAPRIAGAPKRRKEPAFMGANVTRNHLQHSRMPIHPIYSVAAPIDLRHRPSHDRSRRGSMCPRRTQFVRRRAVSADAGP
jgi:hypothetical protein